jgi:hypothetical protein
MLPAQLIPSRVELHKIIVTLFIYPVIINIFINTYKKID